MEPLEKETTATPVSEPLEPASESPATKTGRRESVWETVRSLLIVLLGVFCIRTFIAEATVIPTGSMEQTILIGDHVFLNKLLYGPRLPYTSLRIPPLRGVHRQDIVAFRYPRNPSVMFVKRVIGVGGDVLKIEDRKVFVNGRALKEPYIQFQYSTTLPLRDNFPPPLNVLDTLPAAWGLDPAWSREMPNFIREDGLHVRDSCSAWGTIATTPWTAGSGDSFRRKTWWASRFSFIGRTMLPAGTGRVMS